MIRYTDPPSEHQQLVATSTDLMRAKSDRPRSGTATGQVWDIADEITREKGRCAELSEVIERSSAKGGNRHTAGTQYYKWKQHCQARPPDDAGEVELHGTEEDRPPSHEEAAAEPDSGVEVEREDPQQRAVERPFDPSRIRVRTVNVLVEQIVSRIRHNEIDLQPDFQRMRGIWDLQRKSRLIESFLLRIPIPVFYVAADLHDNWKVVDGVQRLSTIHGYVVGTFPLQRLEYRREFEGKRYDELPRGMQRRISETPLVVNVIEPGTPPGVMFNIFKRINTGGMTLNGQEIRHAVNPGPVREYLKRLADSREFREATGHSIGTQRMQDRECVLRFLAFHIQPWERYAADSLDSHLDQSMKTINRMPRDRLEALEADFSKAMQAASRIFGHDAFRKRYRPDDVRFPVSLALFETWGEQLARCAPEEIDQLVARRTEVRERFMALLNGDAEFEKAISMSTGTPQRIRKRFKAVRDLVEEFL